LEFDLQFPFAMLSSQGMALVGAGSHALLQRVRRLSSAMMRDVNLAAGIEKNLMWKC